MAHSTSQRFKDALRRNHVIATRCLVVDSNGVELVDLDIATGFVTIDSEQAVRRRAYVTLSDPTGQLNPASANEMLHPLSGNRIRLARGINFDPPGKHDIELVELGEFDIWRVEVGDTGEDLTMKVECYDRSRFIQRNRFITNYHIPAGTNYPVAIREMIENQVSGMKFSFPHVQAVTPFLTFGGWGDTGGGNAWDAGRTMAESIGHELFIDSHDTVVLRPAPNITSAPVVWEYVEGLESTLLFVTKVMDNEDTFNHVVVTGESSSEDEPHRAEAVDDDPLSPTYINGPFGDIPTFFRSKFITSTDQASEMAHAILRSKLGVLERVQIVSIVNPMHEAGDVIRIRRLRAKTNARYLINNLTIPLEPTQSLNIVTRRRRA